MNLPAHPPPADERALPGRAGDLAVLRDAVDGWSRDGGALLLVGDPGIGKSALLEAGARHAEDIGTRVLRASGLEYAADLGYSTLAQLLAPLRLFTDDLDAVHRQALDAVLRPRATSAPARVSGAVERREAGPDRLVASTAVLELLRCAADERPLLVVVDDLHWVDRASAPLLGFAARRLAGTRVGLLAAFRPGVEGFFPRAGLPQHRVAPLDAVTAELLVRDRYPDLPPRTVRRLLEEAEGNPLALLELPRALEASHPRRWPGVLPLSHRLQGLFAARIESLPPRTQHLLLLAALESDGDLPLLLRAAGRSADQTSHADLADLDPAERAHLVTADPAGLRLAFRHPLVRSTVVTLAAPEARLAAHRALADELADDPARSAWHLGEAATGPDERVAALLERTAHSARGRGDAVGAFVALLRSADLTPDGAARSRRLADAAYLAAEVTGELPAVGELLVQARRADPHLRGSLRAAVAASYLLLAGDGDIDTAHRLLVGAIRHVRPGGQEDAQALVDALHTLLQVCLFGGRDELWPDFLEVVGRPAPASGLVRLQVAVLADYARCGPGDVRALDAAVESLGEETDPTRIERVATAALFLDRATACRGALWRVVEDGRRGGAVASAITALQVLCLDDVMTGQWEEALRLAREGVALSAEHGYALLGWPFRLAQGVVAAARGLDVELRATVDEMDAWAAPRRARSVVHFARQCAGLAALARGDADAAYRELEVVAAPGTLPFGVPGALWAALDVVEAAAHSGRAEEARAHVEALYDAGIPALSPHLAMLSGAARALVVPEPEATAAFEAAVTVPGAARWPFDLARVQLLQGEHLRRVRRGTPARAPLVAALATFRRLRADPWAARTAAALRATGEPVVPSPESSPGAELTPQEREVALLAASGLTNKQIGERLYLSHRTVGSHLHRIFPKLGITTRAALRDALAPVPADGGQDRTGGAGDSRGPAAGT